MNIAIIGLGLIGGSLGLKLKSLGHHVTGIPRREETIDEAVRIGAIDIGTTDHNVGVKDADIIFICVPINLTAPIFGEIGGALKKGAIVIDVASSKHEIVSQIDKITPKGIYFIGGHPMAGKETVKLSAAEANLFEGKTWILTPTSKTSKKALEKIKETIIQLGCKAVEMDPRLHDLVVAGISHMPLAIAVSLVNAVSSAQKGKEEMKLAASSGFRDTTRIASGDPILGVDMFKTNRKAVLQMISAFKKSLGNLEKLIKEGNAEKIKEELERAKQFRDSI
ncbi:MAG: prephenate dehydrogenase [Candidatus Saganbacteria bacterium]|uniref:Prephenate dehydrogenase n=1 Tax=Candidatus Saganbacteria bacterium TaxID=2575572 RepID=A0A833L1U9_UNCSA|nr:MAG: prephenate dehydrogenase [Candidatus Saganbacteria bacterium]